MRRWMTRKEKVIVTERSIDFIELDEPNQTKLGMFYLSKFGLFYPKLTIPDKK